MPETTKREAGKTHPSKPFPWTCPSCGEKEVRPAEVDHTARVKHDGRLHEVEVPGLRVPRCAACGVP
jgi:hypothetical protein